MLLHNLKPLLRSKRGWRRWSSKPPLGGLASLTAVQGHTQCVTEHEKYALGATKPGGYAASGFAGEGAAKPGQEGERRSCDSWFCYCVGPVGRGATQFNLACLHCSPCCPLLTASRAALWSCPPFPCCRPGGGPGVPDHAAALEVHGLQRDVH